MIADSVLGEGSLPVLYVDAFVMWVHMIFSLVCVYEVILCLPLFTRALLSFGGLTLMT